MRRKKYVLIVLLTVLTIAACALLPWIIEKIDDASRSPWTEPIREIEMHAEGDAAADLTLSEKLIIFSMESFYELGSFYGGSITMETGEHDTIAGLETIYGYVDRILSGLRETGIFDGISLPEGVISFNKCYGFERNSLADGFIFWDVAILFENYRCVYLIIDDETGVLMMCAMDFSYPGTVKNINPIGHSSEMRDWFLQNLGELPGGRLLDLTEKEQTRYGYEWNDPAGGSRIIDIEFSDTTFTAMLSRYISSGKYYTIGE
ncbi:MAG: hypothetical protein IJS22_04525 [Lachnospiraceae bacterium]|nr:hypothetical protein [Lachnospiraceae bacterium]